MPSKSDKIVVVFHSDDCPHCKTYLPLFRRVAVKYRPFIAIKSVKVIAANIALLDKYKIDAFPTTCILSADSEKVLKRAVGALDERQIAALFEKACG